MVKIEKIRIFKISSKSNSYAISYPELIHLDSANTIKDSDNLVMEIVPQGILIRKK